MRVLLAVFVPAMVLAAEPKLEFNRDVRPILSDKCYHCHGPDAKTKGIPLRLDVEAEARAAIAAGKLVARITTDKKGQQMPPPYSGLTLTAREKETLAAWVGQGAEWQPHWSFVPPKAPAGPASIDHFVAARLSKEGLAMRPPASRETQARRVTLDLTGLPPTPQELDAFLRDTSPKAYEKLVDRLLASPRYGERMAARWLDAARYADTNGYQYDGERVMWRWRDYVIDSFNRNKPFDRFVLEQLAGDMLPNATFEQRLATGFNRNHRGNTEDGIVPEEYAVEYVVDRVETTGAVFLGLTLGCARCHNHKYDPLTQKEFYQIFSYFNNVPELGRAMKYGNSPPLMPAPTAEQQAALAALDARIAGQERWLAARAPAIEAARRSWEQTMPAVHWAPASMRDGEYFTQGAPERFDGSRVEVDAKSGKFDIDDRWSVSAWVDGQGSVLTRISGNRPEGKGYGLHVREGKVFFHITSNWVNDALRVETVKPLEPGRAHHVAVTYTGSRMAEGVQVYVDGQPAATTTIMDTLYRPFRNAGGVYKEPVRVGGGAGKENQFQGTLGQVRLYARVLTGEEVAMLAVGQPLSALAGRKRTPPEQRQVELYYLETAAAPEVRAAWRTLAGLREQREKLERTFPTVMVMAEAPQRKPTHLLLRGQYDKPGEVVEPGLPAFLPRRAAADRLGFAQWVVDPANPLLARVTVNRFWQSLFGTGIVKTTEDFGLQGEWPTHPELLDYLATEFIRGGWDTKAMVKRMVMSSAYRQSSQATPELLQRDPDNRLLSRGPRLRMPAEMIRDAALHAAGLLHEKLGGPSVKPYQPEGLWKEVIMQDFEYDQAKGPDLYRRSLYTFWKRTSAPPMMMNFDASQREACTVRENRTNTPLQALNLMNDVTFVEAARFIGQRMLLEGGAEADSRLRHGFRMALGRLPKPAELAVLRGSLNYHLDYFAGKPAEAKALLWQGESRSAQLPERDLAAYQAVASLLLNTDEFVTKE
ncbi:MAG: DUF1553 domain-containing protein [Acidobacteriota bacterium]